MDKHIPQNAIYEILSGLKGTIGLFIELLETGEKFEINPDLVFPSASVIKIPMLALLLKDIREGKADWNAPRTVAANNRVGGTGILAYLDQSYAPSLKTLAFLMITLSDNTATNEIMDLIGIERFNEFWKAQGYEHISLGRKMLDFEAIKQGRNNYMCAGEAGRLLSRIARGECGHPDDCETILDFMAHQQCINKLPSLLPAIPSWASAEERKNMKPGTVLVANKTGDLTGIQHDVGVFTLPDGRRYVIAMFTGGLESDRCGIEAIARVSRAVYDAVK
ncbi:MAG: serine hydrolase [Pyramidobacter sp.]|nr:serine hydrolase [Pyramidobacter sp.]